MDLPSILTAVCLMGLGWLIRSISSQGKTLDKIDSRVHQMHYWLSPDQDGRQAWKDMSPILSSISKTHEQLDRLCVLIEKLLEKD